MNVRNKLELLVSVPFVGLVIWWVSFQSVVDKQGAVTQWFSGLYGVIALIGAIAGFIAAKKWGGFKTVLGRALTFFALGLLAQEAGQLIYAYYVDAAKIQIPYPSYGDIAYFASVLLYITAALQLTKASGAHLSLRNKRRSQIIAFLVPGVLLTSSYAFLLHGHQYDFHKPLTVFLDFGYPMGQAIYISIAITAYLLSRKLLGGIMKSAILLVIFALFTQYLSDSNFIYESSRGTYLSGKYADLMYLIAYFFMSIALIKFYVTYHELRDRTTKKLVNTDTGE